MNALSTVASGILMRLLNVSISAGLFVLAAVGFRLIFRNRLKRVRLVFWALLAIRLLVPVSIESPLGIVPGAETVITAIEGTQAAPSGTTATPVETADPGNENKQPVNSGTELTPAEIQIQVRPSETQVPETKNSGAPVIPLLLGAVWIVGMAAFLVYFVIGQVRVYRKTKDATQKAGNVFYYLKDSPNAFVFGFFRPRIYVRPGNDPTAEQYVILHEKTHIAYGDHIAKPLAFLLLSIYWFHPLLWVAYHLFCRDVEYACDERVIRNMEDDGRAEYAAAILRFGEGSPRVQGIAGFGETGRKERIKAVLNYKKPLPWLIVIGAAAAVIIAVVLFTGPLKKTDAGESQMEHSYTEAELERLETLKKERPEVFALDASEGLNVHTCKEGKNFYSCIITPAAEEEVPLILGLYQLMTVEDTELILSTYGLPDSRVTLHPFFNIFSSYLVGNDIERLKAEIGKLFGGKYAVGEESKIRYDYTKEELEEARRKREQWVYQITLPEDFSFSMTFGVYGVSSYDSKSGKLIKTRDASDTEKYTAYVKLSEDQLKEAYRRLFMDIDFWQYPGSYDPFNAPDAETKYMSEPNQTIVVTVYADGQQKTVNCRGIAFGSSEQCFSEEARAFLQAMYDLQNLITALPEWEALPEPEHYYQ